MKESDSRCLVFCRVSVETGSLSPNQDVDISEIFQCGRVHVLPPSRSWDSCLTFPLYIQHLPILLETFPVRSLPATVDFGSSNSSVKAILNGLTLTCTSNTSASAHSQLNIIFRALFAFRVTVAHAPHHCTYPHASTFISVKGYRSNVNLRPFLTAKRHRTRSCGDMIREVDVALADDLILVFNSRLTPDTPLSTRMGVGMCVGSRWTVPTITYGPYKVASCQWRQDLVRHYFSCLRS